MKISIVTVCKNSAHCIEKALQSVQDQSYDNIEYIVIDGNSTDSTIDIVTKYGDIVHKLVSEPDTGIYSAMNKGTRIATGEFIYFLNSDDYLVDPNVVQDIVKFISQHPNSDVVYGNLEVREKAGHVHVFSPPLPEGIADFMIYGSMPHQATFARLSLFDKFGYFDEHYKLVSDIAWYLNLLRFDEVEWQYLPRTIGSYYSGGSTLSNTWVTRNEFWDAQNRAEIYQTETWSQKRITKFQEVIIGYEEQLSSYNERLSSLKNSPCEPVSDNSTEEYHKLERELDEAQEKFQKLQKEFQELQQSSSQEINERQDTIKRLRARVKENRENLKYQREQLQRQDLEHVNLLEERLDNACKEIDAMRSSKFWKMRSQWIRLKESLKIIK